jgi:hypothetical protein
MISFRYHSCQLLFTKYFLFFERETVGHECAKAFGAEERKNGRGKSAKAFGAGKGKTVEEKAQRLLARGRGLTLFLGVRPAKHHVLLHREVGAFSN